MPNNYDYDLFTIGAGSGGVRASRISAQYGARVAIAEERYLGGTCVNVGCVPKKLLVYASHFPEDCATAASFGWTTQPPRFDWPTLIANKNTEITRLNGIYHQLLERAGVDLIEGRARITAPHTVAVGDRTFTARHILIAVGGWPYIPEFPGSDLAISSNEVFHLPQQPQRLLIVGGGYIAVEFAGIFHGLGTQVTQAYRRDLFLRGFDQDIRTHLRDEMRKKHIDLRFNTNVARIEPHGKARLVTFEDDSTLETDSILYATGRRPLTADLGLETVGITTSPTGVIPVDSYSRTSVDHIHAIGDVTDRVNLTPVAIHEGMALAATLFDNRPTQPCHDNIASAVFSQPPCASVGLPEHQARAAGHNLHIFRSTFRQMKHTLGGSDERTLMKLIVDADTDRVLGVHMVGPEAGEIMQGLAIAIKSGVTKAQFDATIGIHPTAAEEFVTMREPIPQEPRKTS